MKKIHQIKKTTFLPRQDQSSSTLTITLDKHVNGFSTSLDFLDQIELPLENERLILEKKTTNQLVIQIKNNHKEQIIEADSH